MKMDDGKGSGPVVVGALAGRTLQGLGWVGCLLAAGWWLGSGSARVPAAESAGERGRAGVPVGTLVAFAGPAAKVPEAEGWMLCDGRELSVTAYRDLHEVLGTSWGGSANGAVFHLPDLRGRFVRGVNRGADGFGRDREAERRMASAPGGNLGDKVGTVQEESVGPHTHALVGVAEAVAPGLAAEWVRFHGVKLPDETAPVLVNPAAVQPGEGLETRPANVAVHWMIRVR